jgi:hypothetical protein
MMDKSTIILKSFHEMKLSLLEVVLSDNSVYLGTSKNIFIEKISMVFLEFKRNGDSFLQPYLGFCNLEKDCSCNFNCYSFVGNVSQNYFNISFQVLDDESIIFCNCDFIEIRDKSVKRNSSIVIHIKNDEKVDFRPKNNFLIESQEYRLAYEELTLPSGKIIDKYIYLEWLIKYTSFFEKFEFPPYSYTDLYKFYSVFCQIKNLKNFLKSVDKAKVAIDEFNESVNDNETDLLKWLCKFEILSAKFILFDYENIDFDNPDNQKYFTVENLKIATFDFYNIIKFKNLFDKYYWELLDKYTTFSKEENSIYMSEQHEMSKLVCSLTYHLKIRKILV